MMVLRMPQTVIAAEPDAAEKAAHLRGDLGSCSVSSAWENFLLAYNASAALLA